MELTQLYYFYKVAKLEHITKASIEINIAQPALTKSIHKLEEELGVTLFSHCGRNIKLTSWGKWLYEKINDPLNSILNLKNEINILKNNKHIKIGALAASTFVTNAIIEFRKINPDVTFTVLQNNETDCDILVESSNCGYFENIYVGSGNHYKNIIKKSSDLKNIPIITFTLFKELRDTIDQYFNEIKIEPNIAFECDNLNLLHELILNDNGIGFIPEFTSGDIYKDLNLTKLSDYNLSRYIKVTKNPYGLNNGEVVNEFFKYLNKCFESKKILTD